MHFSDALSHEICVTGYRLYLYYSMNTLVEVGAVEDDVCPLGMFPTLIHLDSLGAINDAGDRVRRG